MNFRSNEIVNAELMRGRNDYVIGPTYKNQANGSN